MRRGKALLIRFGEVVEGGQELGFCVLDLLAQRFNVGLRGGSLARPLWLSVPGFNRAALVGGAVTAAAACTVRVAAISRASGAWGGCA